MKDTSAIFCNPMTAMINQKRNENVNHICPKCNLHGLTFEEHSISVGKQIQFGNCKICGFE